MPSGRDQTAAQSGRACLTAAPPPLHNPCCRAVPSPRVQSEVAWLIKAVNPEVPLGEAALGLILEEVGVRRRGLSECGMGAGGDMGRGWALCS